MLYILYSNITELSNKYKVIICTKLKGIARLSKTVKSIKYKTKTEINTNNILKAGEKIHEKEPVNGNMLKYLVSSLPANLTLLNGFCSSTDEYPSLSV
jgi:hypothetical protein